jgi:glycerophosphoryl diester phosphodiesterase
VVVWGSCVSALACLAPTDLRTSQDPQQITTLLNLRCADARPRDVDPRTGTLWLQSDSLLVDSLVLFLGRATTTGPIRCSVDTIGLGNQAGVPTVAGIHSVDDSTFSVLLTGRSIGRMQAGVTLNTARVFTFDILTTSRTFGDHAWGHGGAGTRVPENTRLAVQIAIVAGLPGSEVDVRLTRDTVPVLMHDETVDRTTSGLGRVDALTAAEITMLDAGVRRSPEFAGERVPTLFDVLELAVVGQHRLILDVKDQRVVPLEVEARLLVDLVVSLDAEALVTISSPSPTFLRAARQRSPDVRLALLSAVYRPGHLSLALNLGVNAILYHFSDSLVTPSVITGLDSLHRAGIDVIASTTNRPSLGDSLLTLTPIRTMLSDTPPRVYRLRMIPRF